MLAAEVGATPLPSIGSAKLPAIERATTTILGVASCVAAVIAGVEFPKPKGKDAIVRVPLAFQFVPR